MTSTAQIVGAGIGGVPGFGAAAAFGRPYARDETGSDERDVNRLPGRNSGDESEALPGRRPPETSETGRAATDVPRLPGQEGPPEGGPRRPLISGGAFTLAVAIGLALDELGRPEEPKPGEPDSGATAEDGDSSGEVGLDGLTEAERETVRDLQQRDAEVRRHEAAHAAAGGQYAGAPSFSYQTGPDGKRYAVGGEVSIDTSPVKGDPAATIQKAQQIKAAANAPADPSSQDRRVAAAANALQQSAQSELLAQQRAEREAAQAETAPTDTTPTATAPQAAPEAAAPAAPPAVTPTTPGPEASNPAPEAAAPAVPQAANSAPGNGPGNGPDTGPGPATTATGNTGATDVGTNDTGTPQGAAGPADAASGSPDPDAGTSEPDRDDDDRNGGFAAAAFSAAAASYRGPAQRPNLVSLAV